MHVGRMSCFFNMDPMWCCCLEVVLVCGEEFLLRRVSIYGSVESKCVPEG